MRRVPGPVDPEGPDLEGEAGAVPPSARPLPEARIPAAPMLEGPSGPAPDTDEAAEGRLVSLARVIWSYRKLPTRRGAVIAAVIGLLAVLGATAFVFGELRPGLLFGPGVDIGGDNGGHIAAPYFMIHYLLPRGRITGWDPWWFDGFPLYVLYFPLPAVLVAAFSTVASYTVAFKIVTALGALTLPVCAYAFGRLVGFRRPVPVLMALATVPYLFNTSYTIDGGNLASTMAGEFSFSLAISTGVLFLGVVGYSLRTGRLRWLAALLFAVTCLNHVVPALAFAGTAVVMILATLRPRSIPKAIRIVAPIGVVGALLAAWWLLPFAADLQYSSSMNYQPVGGPWPSWFTTNFLPKGYLFMLIPAALGALWSIVARNRVAFSLAVSAVLAVVIFHWMPSGLVYNARWLPFWFLYASLLAAYGIGELVRLVGRYSAPSAAASVGITLGLAGALVGSVFTGGLEGSGFLGYTAPPGHIQVSGWIEWNYSGLQAKSGWGVFQDMVRLLDRAGARYGCGRLQYEYLSETTDPFGSTEEMMSLPMWTHGCMQTTDGIYFESSTTTPFHFLDVSQVSQDGEAPDPVVGLNYPGFDLADGIRHLQLMGVRYFLAMSPPVEAIANTDRALQRIGSAPSFPGPYNHQQVKHPQVVLYLIRHSPLVAPMSHLPFVEPSGSRTWLKTNLRWYEQEQYWPEFLARSGPATWPRAPAGTLPPPSRAVPAATTTVSDIRPGVESISFHVTRLDTPVLVKVPYFPNWSARGAEGPYEVSPNLMAVVPTAHHVLLTYGTTAADWGGKAAALAGLAGLVGLAVVKPASPAMPAGAPGPPPAVVPDEGDERPLGAEEEPETDGPPDDELELSLVLPAHNEEALIAETVDELVAALRARGRRFELIVVENGSDDATAEKVRGLGQLHPEVRLVRLVTADYGEALRTGFLAATGRTVVNFDVDYHDVAFLDAALGAIERGEAAVVLASKRAPGSSDRRPLSRRMLTAAFTATMRSLLQVPVSDAHGMKALDRRALAPVVAASRLGGPVFDVELVVRAHRQGLSILEMPTEVREVRPARTSVVRRTVQSLKGLVKLRFILGPDRPT